MALQLPGEVEGAPALLSFLQDGLTTRLVRSRKFTVPAPVRGWVTNENIAAQTPQTAKFIDSGTLVINQANLDSYKDDLKKITSDIQGKFKDTYLNCQ